MKIGSESEFKGVIDLVEMKAITWTGEELGANFNITDVPEDQLDKAKEYRDKMLENIVELDDEAMMLYLEGKIIF